MLGPFPLQLSAPLEQSFQKGLRFDGIYCLIGHGEAKQVHGSNDSMETHRSLFLGSPESSSRSLIFLSWRDTEFRERGWEHISVGDVIYASDLRVQVVDTKNSVIVSSGTDYINLSKNIPKIFSPQAMEIKNLVQSNSESFKMLCSKAKSLVYHNMN